MRYMVIVKANADSEAGKLPTAEEIAEMGRFNEKLIAAGILLAADGLQASSQGARVRFDAGRTTVLDGPFAETKELVAGYWLIDVKSKDEAIEWVKRIPFSHGEEVELRKVFEFSDFPDEIVSSEHRARAEAWRDGNQKPVAG